MDRRQRRRRRGRPTLIAAAAAALAAASIPSPAAAQTSLTGGSMLMRNTTATLSSNGYVGTYLNIPAGGATINLTVNATRGGTGTGNPHLNLVIADTLAPFSVTSSANYTTSNITLPAGTYVVRAERDYGGNVGVTRSFTVNNLSVNTVGGAAAATFANDAASANTNALAAANTYINHFRRGQANVAVSGPGAIPLLAGTPLNVDLRRHAFNFGTAVAGFNGSTFLQNNPAPGSDNFKYQQAIKTLFNAVVPENAGKWASNSSGSTPTTSFDISYNNAVLNFAQQNNMRARMHNLIWGAQQPAWVNSMLTSDPATLRSTYIPHRIGYYVGDASDGNPNDDPAQKYVELDVYNESVHTPQYWNAYGAAGVAGIYNDVAAAAASVGAGNVKLFTNEYNVLADGTDAYANWYRNNIEAIRNAGGAVGGIGIQYYANNESATGGSAHSPQRIQQTLQNLSVQGIALALTEFGVKPTASQAHAAQVLSDTVPLVFGTPNSTGFFMWGFWHKQMWGNAPGETNGAAGAAFYNDDWTPTPALAAWQNLMSQWDTNLTALADANGNVSFTGFYGDYFLRGQTSGAYDMTLTKGTSNYAVNMPGPPTWSLWNAATSGNWGTGANWTAGGVANAAGQTAYFGPAAAARTINVDGPRTLGMLAFNSAGSGAYAINGSGTITLAGFDNAAGNRAAIYVAAGSHAINAPLLLADDTTVTVASAASTLTVADLQPSAAAITKRGAGTLDTNAVRAAGLDVAAGTVRLRANAGASNVAALTIGPDAKLDLTSNSLVTDTPAGTFNGAAYTGVQGDVARAYNFGAWDQPGLTTSEERAGQNAGNLSGTTTIGVATAEQVLFIAPAETGVFAGQTVNGATTIAMYTYAGDLNFDGLVDGADYGVIDNSVQFPETSGYANGDFNYDGVIDGADYGIIDNTIQLQGAPLLPASEALKSSAAVVAAVPEPAAVTGAIVACGVTTLRRRRRE